MREAQVLAESLGGRRVGNQYMAQCPAHNDRNPSLSITTKDGKLLFHCHSGCPQHAVLKALRERGALGRAERPENRRIVESYDYRDLAGELLYQVVRFDPKDFRPRYSDGAGGWIWRKHPTQVLYHLREVMEAPIVFLVEGERDAETLRAQGFVATTNAGGANAPWLPQYNEVLAGREVNIVPDNEAPGWERGRRVAAALLGHAARNRLH